MLKELLSIKSTVSEVFDHLPEFTDIYVHEGDPENKSFLWPGPVSLINELKPFAVHAHSKAKNSLTKDFRISYQGVNFRAHRMTTMGGNFIACRRMPNEVWSLQQCKMHSSIRNILLDARCNRGGLIAICGKPGNGKSTTCAAIITERLKLYGGMCLTIEDPAEMPLHGMWGEGICFQREVQYDQFPEAIRDAMRAYPTRVNTLMLIGEVRDPETAALALQSAVDGRLVLITMHSGNVIQGTQRLLTLAAQKIGMDEARALLASSIRSVLHQRMEGPKMNLNILCDTTSVVGKIISPDTSVEQLKNDLKFQMSSMKLAQKVPLRIIR